MSEPFTEYGRLVESGPYSGLTSEQALEKMAADAKAKRFRRSADDVSPEGLGNFAATLLGHSDSGGLLRKRRNRARSRRSVAGQLPLDMQADGQGQSPLATFPEFVNTNCPKCGGPARRETDTMDTFMDSSWYFYRYTDPHNDKAPFDKEKVRYWFQIDQYIGGVDARDSAPDLLAIFLQGDARPGSGESRRADQAPLLAGHGARRAA